MGNLRLPRCHEHDLPWEDVLPKHPHFFFPSFFFNPFDFFYVLTVLYKVFGLFFEEQPQPCMWSPTINVVAKLINVLEFSI